MSFAQKKNIFFPNWITHAHLALLDERGHKTKYETEPKTHTHTITRDSSGQISFFFPILFIVVFITCKERKTSTAGPRYTVMVELFFFFSFFFLSFCLRSARFENGGEKKITTMTKCWTRRHGVRTEWTGRFGGGRRRLSGSRKLRRPCRGSFWERLCRIRRCRAWRWTIARWVRSRRAARRPGSPSAPASARLRDWWCWGGRAEGRGSRRGSSRRGSRAALRSSRSSRRR